MKMDNSNKKFRLAVVNDWHDKKSAVFWNKDGFLKMLHVLRERDGWDVRFFKKHNHAFNWEHDYVDLAFSTDPVSALKEWEPDAILFFCDLSRPVLNDLRDYDRPKAICYTGGRFTDFIDVPDLIFVESKTYVDWFNSMGKNNVVQAFGTNTELFKPMKMPKYWDGIFPATGAAWKRHGLFAEAMKDKGLVCGWWQPHEPQCLEVCLENGTGVLHHQMPESLVYLYNMAHTCVITSSDVGGSQRTVLEAMACNIPVVVMNDSTMTTEYVEHAGGSIVNPDPESIRKAVDDVMGTEVNTREWIIENYSEFIYADKVKEGIESICSNSKNK